jgi:hypothetical protein
MYDTYNAGDRSLLDHSSDAFINEKVSVACDQCRATLKRRHIPAEFGAEGWIQEIATIKKA